MHPGAAEGLVTCIDNVANRHAAARAILYIFISLVNLREYRRRPVDGLSTHKFDLMRCSLVGYAVGPAPSTCIPLSTTDEPFLERSRRAAAAHRLLRN